MEGVLGKLEGFTGEQEVLLRILQKVVAEWARRRLTDAMKKIDVDVSVWCDQNRILLWRFLLIERVGTNVSKD